MKFRKKPVVVEAVRWTGDNIDDIDKFIGSADHLAVRGRTIKIRTLEGVMECQPGDWLVRGVKGEYYPVKPDIFEETYEPVITREGT